MCILMVILSDVQNLQMDHTLSDVTIKIGAKSFPAHKNIIAASSGYFNAMFTCGFRETEASEVTIEGDSVAFEILLNYIYTGELNNLTNGNVNEVLGMACYLDLTPHAVQECKRSIFHLFKNNSISMEEAFHISLRPEPDIRDVANVAKWYILRNFTDLVKKPGFVEETSYECLDRFVDSIHLQVTNEEVR